jgi:hypothetical protein
MANDFNTLDELIASLQKVREKHGGHLRVNVSVFQEPNEDNPHGGFYEDRPLCNHVEVVVNDHEQFVELAV